MDGIADLNPFFKEALEKGQRADPEQQYTAADDREFRMTRDEFVYQSRQADDRYRKAGHPDELVADVQRAYAPIPQDGTWLSYNRAAPSICCAGGFCRHNTSEEQRKCPFFQPRKRVRAVMTYCDQWGFRPKEALAWAKVPPSLFDALGSRWFQRLDKAQQKQVLRDQAKDVEIACVIHRKHLRHELRWCLSYVDGRHDKEDWDTTVERAQLRRLRQFDYPRFRRKYGVRPG